MWHMPNGITLHIAPKNSNSCYLLWNHSTDLPASTTTGPSYRHCSSQHHHVPSNGLSFMWFLALLLPILMFFSRPQSHYQATPRQKSLQATALNFFLHEDYLKDLTQDFYSRNVHFGNNNLSKLSAPPRALHQHTRVPCKLSEKSRDDYRTLLVLLLIANCDAFPTTSVLLPSPFSARLH